MATNLRPLAKKLQTALAVNQHRYISINQYQCYSPKAQRTCTKYILSEKIDGKYNNLLSTFSFPDVVKFLGEQWNNNIPDTDTEGS